jgi:3',5'-cyclic AMP phosphodiesterase CpdA
MMRIAHISDIHANIGTDFNPKIYDKAVKILNKQEADIIFLSGDVTTWGLLPEYELAQEKLKSIKGNLVIVPGNHDERNLGYKLFPEFFGEPTFIKDYGELTLVGLASSEPDKDDGRLGRIRHQLIEKGIQKNKKMTVIGFHHHLIPVPNSGRETNIIEDAGETLDILLQHDVPLVLMGHRHVPYGVRIHNTLLVNAGTFSCTRTRAHFGYTFNLIDINDEDILVSVVDVEKEKFTKMIKVNTEEECYLNRYYESTSTID